MCQISGRAHASLAGEVLIIVCFVCCSRQESRLPLQPGPAEHGTDKLHEQAADWVRKGIPLQQVPDAGQADRNRGRAGPQRDTGENLVSKSANEAEEADEGRRGNFAVWEQRRSQWQ